MCKGKKRVGRKGQAGFGFTAIVLSVAIVAILVLIMVLVMSRVGNSGDELFDKTAGFQKNESVTATVNSYVSLAHTDPGDCVITEAINASNNVIFNCSTLTLRGCRINLSCDKNDPTQCPSSTASMPIKVSYTYNNWTDLDARSSYAGTRSTGLDALDLVTIGLVVLAAMGIIGVVLLLAKAGGGGAR